MLIRSWNLFHGNAFPPRQESYLEEMVRLACADGPAVLLLQEIPVWALSRLGGWSEMTAVVDVSQRPRIGPIPISAGAGRSLTGLNPGLLRSAFSGQGNAVLLAPDLQPVAHEVLTLNDRGFRRTESQRLRLDPVARLAWAKERRICQLVRVERDDGQAVTAANLHATSSPGDPRLPAAELRRAADFAAALAEDGDVLVVGGDFNVTGVEATLDGFSPPGPWIDHVIVRGAPASPLRVWPDERRCRGGMMLSDHAPIELDL